MTLMDTNLVKFGPTVALNKYTDAEPKTDLSFSLQCQVFEIKGPLSSCKCEFMLTGGEAVVKTDCNFRISMPGSV